MTSKTKALKKGIYKPGDATPAPAKAENKATKVASVNHLMRDKRKEIEQRSRARRIRSLMKLGVAKEQIEEWMHEEDNRFVLCLIYDSFFIIDGTKKKKVYKRDETHRVYGVEEQEVDNVLHGIDAFKKFCENNKLKIMSTHKGSFGHAGWILSDKDNVDNVVELLKPVGRTSITKPEPHTVEKPKKEKKPTNNTAEAKKSAKAKRKAQKIHNAKMRPYYAALRKGGVSARIKKYNKSLAEKIEAWIAEKKKADTLKAEKNKEYRAVHRQLTSSEMKANKRARKAARHLAAQERRREQEKKRMDNNAKTQKKRAQKPIQTELKMAA